MNTLTLERDLCVEKVKIDSSTITVELSDGRAVSNPLVWYPRLLNGTVKERSNWELIGDGQGLHWPDLDEDLSMEGMIQGRPSFESQKSFQKWIVERRKRGLAAKFA